MPPVLNRKPAMVAWIAWSDEQTNAVIVNNILHFLLDYAQVNPICFKTDPNAGGTVEPTPAISQFVYRESCTSRECYKIMYGTMQRITANDEAASEAPASGRAPPGESGLEKLPMEIFYHILQFAYPAREIVGTADAYGDMLIDPLRYWSDMPLYQVSRGLRSLMAEIYGQPEVGFFPFDSIRDTLCLEFSAKRSVGRLCFHWLYRWYVTDAKVATERFQHLMNVQCLRRVKIINLKASHTVHNAPMDRVAWPSMLEDVQKYCPFVTHLRLVLRGVDGCCQKPQYPRKTAGPDRYLILSRACWEAYLGLEKVLTGSQPIRPRIIEIVQTGVSICTEKDELCVAIPVADRRPHDETKEGGN